MKRTIFVSALMVALLVAFSGEAFSRSAPWGYADPGTGDDHTWGGDFQAGSDEPGGQFDGINDAWISADMIITSILFKWLGLSSLGDQSDAEADHIIQNQIIDDEPSEPITPNLGGNL